MANIELVIKIPKEQYNAIKSNLYNTFPAEMKEWGLEAIRNGTPLPKGHGSLKDADAIRKTISESIEECKKWADEVKGGEMYARVSQSLGTFVECSLRIKNEQTIIKNGV